MKRWLTPRRAAWLASILGTVTGVIVFAPAVWMANAIHSATAGKVQLLNARGTVWSGHADLKLTGGDGSRTVTGLPQGIHWRLSPGWADGQPAALIQLSAPCCTPAPLQATVLPGMSGATVRLNAPRSHWPAELLTGLGTPWNTLRLDGLLALETERFELNFASGRLVADGTVTVEALDVASRVATIRPLGSYQVAFEASKQSRQANITLKTLNGSLLLDGSGLWTGSRVRFTGEARAAAGKEAALNNLLNIIGRRQGAASLIRIG